jgi:glycosyltransferase involved in cell wall biosynthesis
VVSQSGPQVTFIVPCYNYGRYLEDCLDSIFAQQGEQDFEVIAIDDASTDDTQRVLEGYGDERLRVIMHPKNQGHARTMNEGLQESRGQFVARIDPDDRYRPSFLSTVLPIFAGYPEVGLVYGDAAQIDAQGTVTVVSSDAMHAGRDYRGNELVPLLESNFICAPTVIARREAWLSAAPVPNDLAFNDWYFTLMMARKHTFYYVHRVLADYRVHPGNMHAAITRDKTEEPSIFRLLDMIFSEREADAGLQQQKERARRHVYASHYLTLGDKYFGSDMDSDACRCYLRAARFRPTVLGRPDVLRHLSGTVMGRGRYERMKYLAKRSKPRNRRDHI